MKKIVSSILALVLVIIVTGCGGSSSSGTEKFDSKKVELTLAYPGSDTKRDEFEKFLKTFNDKNPGIAVKVTFVPNKDWADYFNKLETMSAAGNPPDVVRVAIEGIQMFVQKGLALPLDDMMKADPAALDNYDDIHAKLQSPFVIDGKTYGFAWDWNNIVVHFNTDMLKKANLPLPPKNWNKDDVLKYAQAMTTEANGQKTYGFAVPNNYFALSGWMFNNDASILNPDMTKSTLDDPKAIEVMQFFQDMIYKYKVAPVPNAKTDVVNQMVTGQVAMISAGKWPFGTFEKSNFKTSDVQFVPTLRTQKVIFGSGAFPVMKATKHPKEAYQLSAYLSGTDSQKTLLSTAAIPARKSVMNEALPKTPASNWKIYAESADIAKPVEAPKDYAGVAGIVDRYMSEIYSNQTDAATAMKKAKEEIDQLIEKSK